MYGFGRSNWGLIYLQSSDKMGKIYSDFQTNPIKMRIENQIPLRVNCGFHHNLVLTNSNRLFTLGNNIHGQCGASNLIMRSIDKFAEVLLDLENGEKII